MEALFEQTIGGVDCFKFDGKVSMNLIYSFANSLIKWETRGICKEK